MTERPILFSGAMVRAILAGGKTQTRRVVKGDWTHTHPACPGGICGVYVNSDDPAMRLFTGTYLPCPYGAPGDRLWVRETWKPWPNTAGPELRGPDDMGAIYAATWDKSGGHGWKPSIHMPRWASRITLEVTGVRVERVQDISEADCCAELGAPREWPGPGPEPYKRNLRGSFAERWNLINGKREGCAWPDNPWVWVVEFRRVQL